MREDFTNIYNNKMTTSKLRSTSSDSIFRNLNKIKYDICLNCSKNTLDYNDLIDKQLEMNILNEINNNDCHICDPLTGEIININQNNNENDVNNENDNENDERGDEKDNESDENDNENDDENSVHELRIYINKLEAINDFYYFVCLICILLLIFTYSYLTHEHTNDLSKICPYYCNKISDLNNLISKYLN